ncbi:MAG TPA: VOC family protein [Gemmatimonadota bacterium]
MSAGAFYSLTPVLVVDAIEPSLDFWVDRLGFEKTVEVPEGERLGFVILQKGPVQVMLQTRESLDHDAPSVLPPGPSPANLFVIVDDLDEVERVMIGIAPVLPRRKTFYGMDEIGFREPGGHVVVFAKPVGEDA